MRKFEDTHKWLTFTVDMLKADPELWLMLGECQSKCEHLARYPLRPDISEEIHKLYLVKGAFATTAIEGNTLTEEEVRQILDRKLELPPSRQYLAKEVENVIDECHRIWDSIIQGSPIFYLSVDRIKQINAAILNDLAVPDHVIPGGVRTYSVGVGLYKGAPHEDCEYLLESLVNWLNDEKGFSTPDNPRAKVFAILKAVVAHIYIAWIHPFGDGNGRTARMMEYQILLASGIPSPAAHLLSNHYYQTHAEYYRQLQYASESGGDVLPFINYAVRGFLDGLIDQLKLVKRNVMDAVWRNLIADSFKEATTEADLRRKDLIEDLSTVKVEGVLGTEALMWITPRVAKHYKNRTRKTLLRDLRILHDMRLIKYEDGFIRPRKEEMLSFVPLSTDEAR